MRLTLILILILLYSSQVIAQESVESSEESHIITADNAQNLEPQITMGYGYINDIIFSPDGKLFIVSTPKGLVVYDALSPNDPIEHISTQSGTDLGFSSPDLLVIVGYGRVEIIDITTWDTLATIEGLVAPYLSGDMSMIKMQTDDEILRWSAIDGEQLSSEPLPEDITRPRPEGSQLGQASDSAISPDQLWTAYVGWGGVNLYNNETGEGFALIGGCCDPAQETVSFSPDSKVLVIGDSNGGVDFVDIETKEITSTVRHFGRIEHLAYHPEGQIIAVASSDGIIRYWDTESFEEQHIFTGYIGGVSVMSFTPENERLILAGVQGTAWRWDVATGEQLSTKQGYDFWIGNGTIPYPTDIDITANAYLLATGTVINGDVLLWTPQGRRRGTFETWRGANIHALAFSHDGQKVAAVAYQDVYLWDLETGEQLRRFEKEGATRILDFTLDNQSLLIGDNQGTVTLYDIETGEAVRTYRSTSSVSKFPDVRPLALSPDGDLMAFAVYCYGCTLDKRVYNIWVYKVATGDLVHRLQGHTEFVSNIVFNRDRSLLVSSSINETLFWDLDDGTSSQPIPDVRLAKFSLDGTLIATFDYDGIIQVWNIPTP